MTSTLIEKLTRRLATVNRNRAFGRNGLLSGECVFRSGGHVVHCWEAFARKTRMKSSTGEMANFKLDVVHFVGYGWRESGFGK